MSQIGGAGDVPQNNESMLSLGASISTEELLRDENEVSLSERLFHNDNPSIVPNSARTLSDEMHVVDSWECVEKDNKLFSDNFQLNMKHTTNLIFSCCFT